jgi:hypothetical protein
MHILVSLSHPVALMIGPVHERQTLGEGFNKSSANFSAQMQGSTGSESAAAGKAGFGTKLMLHLQ